MLLANEKEYFSNMHRMVIKDERSVPGQKAKSSNTAPNEGGDDGEQGDPEYYEERDDTLDGDIKPVHLAFTDSGLDKTQEQLFVEGLLPTLEKGFGLSTPKPDLVFGFEMERFPTESTPRLSDNVLQVIRVAPGIEHPFFVIEAKGGSAPIEEAENQAIRSGAALVNARRLLEQMIPGVPQPVIGGPDPASWVFSCAWVPRMAEIFVHWLEFNSKGEPIYHMNLIQSYMMSRAEELQAFRRAIHNILDWGLQPARRQALDELLVAIAAAEEVDKGGEKGVGGGEEAGGEETEGREEAWQEGFIEVGSEHTSC